MNVRIQSTLAFVVAAMLIVLAWDRAQGALTSKDRPLTHLLHAREARPVIYKARDARARGDIKGAARYYRTAIEWSPYDSSYREELGLLLDAAGEQSSAEVSMLEAARLARSFAPRWSLANFYFRLGRRDLANFWLREASTVAGNRSDALFVLCQANNPRLEDTLAMCIGRAPEIVSSYAEYLVKSNRVHDAIHVVSNHNIDVSDRARGVVLDATFSAGLYDKALSIWNDLAVSGVVGSKPTPSLLVNGDFTKHPTSRGFDWHVCSDPGVEVNQNREGMTFHASGNQPENLNAMWQTTSLNPNHRYQFRFTYKTEGLEPGTGPTWTITSPKGVFRSQVLNSSDWREDYFPLTGDGWSRVTLSFDRRPGYRRMEGSIWLRKAQVVEVQ